LWPIRTNKNLEIILQDWQTPRVPRIGLSARTRGKRSRSLWGSRQNRVHKRLFCKIDSPAEQVKNETLAIVTKPCPRGQVLANSQRCCKIRLHRNPAFAMLTVGSQHRGSPADVCPFRRNFN
jgi:hypothetical protein